MDDPHTAMPVPLVFTRTGAPYADIVVAVAAIAQAAQALDWALRGDRAFDVTQWMHVTRAAVLRAPDLESALAAEGIGAAAARKLARRIAPLAERTPLGPEVPDGQWVGVAGATGVPASERPFLVALAELALAAAADLAEPEAPGQMCIAPFVTSVDEPGARTARGPRWAGMLATRLDASALLLERERLDVLALAGSGLVERCEGLEHWIARPSDPTIRVRIPDEHPAVPFAFVAFVARRCALDALADGAVVDEAVSAVERALETYQHGQRRAPQ